MLNSITLYGEPMEEIEHIRDDFERLFKTYFKKLHSYAQTILRDSEMAEEIVQNVFYKLWEKKDRLTINESIKAYLYRSVYNESLNYLKHRKVADGFMASALPQSYTDVDAFSQLAAKELEAHLAKALNELPEKCRTVFQMCRYEQLKYSEIAGELQIPVKTVENQMGKALRLLREKLSGFLSFLLIIQSLS